MSIMKPRSEREKLLDAINRAFGRGRVGWTNMSDDELRAELEALKSVKPVLTMVSRDTVSGITIFDDGAKVFWTEGPGVELTVLHADGHGTIEFENSIYAKAMENGIDGPHRQMNLLEEHEYAVARNGGQV